MTTANLGEGGSLETRSGDVASRRDLISRLEGKKIDIGSALKAFIDDDPADPNEYAAEYRSKIQNLGFNLEETKRALSAEAVHVLGLRISDIQRGAASFGSESSEQRVKDETRKLGFDPDDLDLLTEIREKLLNF